MSSCKTNRKNVCGRPTRGLVTLEAMIRDFVDRFRPGERDELAFFKEHPFTVALDHAALAKDCRGKRFSHQRRLTRESLAKARGLLFEKQDELKRMQCFEGVLKIVQGITRQVRGLGELYAYDTALRISAALGYEPVAVYLHAGTRVGAKRLGISTSRDYVSTLDLPVALQKLPPHEVESFLCIYKNQLGTLAGKYR